MKIAHISDIHFGKIINPEIVSVLVQEVNEAGVDVVAVSGDLTQRAKPVQFEAAAAMIDAFEPPTIVVPGNHDVYAWWYPRQRLFSPLRRYKRYITDDLTPCFEHEGLAVMGINSAYGRTVKGGRIDRDQREAMATFFARRSDEAFKVLVVHHHLTRILALGPHDVARKARQTLRVASDVGIDLILCGHLHISHIEPAVIKPTRHRIVIASAGTATSNRGRLSNRRTNFYNIIDVAPDHFTIEERRYDPDARCFVRDDCSRFDRTRENGTLLSGTSAVR